MNWFLNLPFRTKLSIPLGLITLILVISTLIGVSQLASLQQQVDRMTQTNLPAMDYLVEADRDMQQALVAERSMLSAQPGTPLFARFEKDHADNIDQARTRMGKFKDLVDAPAELALVAQFEQDETHWAAVTRAIVQQVQQAGPADRSAVIAASFGEGDRQFEKTRHNLDQLEDLVRHDVAALRTASAAKYAAARLAMMAVAALGILLCLIMLVTFPRIITRPLLELRQFMQALADGHGDLTRRMQSRSQDEIGRLAQDFNRFMEDLGELVRTVASHAHAVNSAAASLSATSGQVAQASAQQSNAALAAAGSISGLTEQVQQIVASTQAAETISTEAATLSQEGEQIASAASAEISKIAASVTQSSELILALGQRSNEISGIVKVIRDIAEQTNLLALNAAIEAARAGEQGRGFAVVADEVRKLAERTSVATTEITGMIAVIQNETQSAVASMEAGREQVSQGVLLANEAAQSLSRIHDSVNHTVQRIHQIADTTREQNDASGQIAHNVAQIAQMAEANNQAITASAAAARELEQLADRLENLVGRFHV